ncbi:MAG: hypothetical protein LBR97_00745 [Dysgonamonadaceae bacterium]|jgi:hypothetical protein|nr:hypothetical protein [Dysgonamonadaceae bacterium]
MAQTTIRQLLDKYWNCETSPEEEQFLTGYFSGDSVPEEWRKYQVLFAWKKTQTLVKATPKLKAELGRQPFVAQFYSVVKIAASVLLIMTIGIGFYTHYRQVQWMDKVFSETYSDPADALRDTQNAIEKVSSVLNLMQEQKSDMEETDFSPNDSVQ